MFDRFLNLKRYRENLKTKKTRFFSLLLVSQFDSKMPLVNFFQDTRYIFITTYWYIPHKSNQINKKNSNANKNNNNNQNNNDYLNNHHNNLNNL